MNPGGMVGKTYMKIVSQIGASARNIAGTRKHKRKEMTFKDKLADPYLRAVLIGAVTFGVIGIALLVLLCVLE